MIGGVAAIRLEVDALSGHAWIENAGSMWGT